jgi:hypothetical protein
MKIFNTIVDVKFVGQVLTSIILGGFVGFVIDFLRDNHIAVFLCAAAAGMSAITRLRKQQIQRERNA